MAMSNDDYIRKMAAMQNDYFNQTSYKRNPLEGVDIKALSMNDLELMIQVLTKEYDRRHMDTPLPSPTRRQLQTNPALKEAYEAMQIILKLQGQ